MVLLKWLCTRVIISPIQHFRLLDEVLSNSYSGFTNREAKTHRRELRDLCKVPQQASGGTRTRLFQPLSVLFSGRKYATLYTGQ